jgi:hypothetical protein
MMTSAAMADSVSDTAWGAAGIISFNKTCEPVPPAMLAAAEAAKASVPAAVYSQAAMNLFEDYLQMRVQTGSKAAWCAKVKSVLSKG